MFLDGLPVEAQEAFQKLCTLGCDKETLGVLLFLLSLSNEIVSVGRPETAQTKIPFNAFDSYETAFEGLSRKALNLKAREAKKVAKTYCSMWESYRQLRNTVVLLRRSPGVEFLIQLGSIRKKAFFTLPRLSHGRCQLLSKTHLMPVPLLMSLNPTCQVWSNFQRPPSRILARSRDPT